jgi:uncharacterized protein
MVKTEILENLYTITKKYIELLNTSNIFPSSAYLFGSYTQNRQHEDSDIDIALVLPNIENAFEESINLTLIGSHVDSRIEPHLFSDSEFNEENLFAKDIIENGIKVL